MLGIEARCTELDLVDAFFTTDIEDDALGGCQISSNACQ